MHKHCLDNVLEKDNDFNCALSIPVFWKPTRDLHRMNLCMAEQYEARTFKNVSLVSCVGAGKGPH